MFRFHGVKNLEKKSIKESSEKQMDFKRVLFSISDQVIETEAADLASCVCVAYSFHPEPQCLGPCHRR